ITEQLPAQSLTEISSQRPDWKQLMPLLEKAGSLLCDMHLHKISHGAFYPNHLYLNPTSGQVFLIDFERSRRCLTAASAVRRDLYQFLKRASVMPVSALEQLLASHRRQFPKLTEQLVNHYHANRTV
ncbi:MAG: hypothetical protein KDA77_22590, partial [Planctomycetaceae bacterium]|nr:hypothetical protein [Planctomycetaceae bacterium]